MRSVRNRYGYFCPRSAVHDRTGLFVVISDAILGAHIRKVRLFPPSGVIVSNGRGAVSNAVEFWNTAVSSFPKKPSDLRAGRFLAEGDVCWLPLLWQHCSNLNQIPGYVGVSRRSARVQNRADTAFPVVCLRLESPN